MDTKGQCHFAKHVRTSLFCNIFFCLIVFRISRKTSSVCEKCGQHYRDSLVYWLQFKDDDEFPSVAFGNIAGGSAPWARRPSACSAPFRELRVPKARLLRDREPHPAECAALQASAQVRRSDSSGSRQTPAASQRSAAVRPACRTYATGAVRLGLGDRPRFPRRSVNSAFQRPACSATVNRTQRGALQASARVRRSD